MNESSFLPSGVWTKKLTGKVSWQSPSNIALIKYWGKFAEQIPMNPSISFTLKNCHTRTTLYFEPKDSEGFDFTILLDGKEEKSFEPKIRAFFKRTQKYLPFLENFKFRVETSNSFPHSSGIASSASGMSALALCLVDMENQLQSKVSGQLSEMEFQKASFLSRLGSGSACRSLEGPIIVWGEHSEIGNSSNFFGTKYPYQVHPRFLDYKDCILLVDKGEKQVSSTVGHNLMTNHPYAEQRFIQAKENLSQLIAVLKSGDLTEFIKIVESEALSLHAMMLTSMPYFILMKPNTLEIINRIWKFRETSGSKACFTLDAGANVHLLYPETEKEMVLQFIKEEVSQYCKNGEYILDEVGMGARPF